jgi:hypothetical protein
MLVPWLVFIMPAPFSRLLQPHTFQKNAEAVTRREREVMHDEKETGPVAPISGRINHPSDTERAF